eukprot:CAMPEP_0177237872 /NCGR_PEP_ID=MMETSP0367-20130122/46227_1 /TAXON_ID=447022 ORGANISM="Scrippsiella hangoei-like, Strain SHHI-4" /NCGR_SAMPLE_ID=MMETSP0367 /ASSEMBLY_ACC=CAM_ASM_000362 /LENGTH=49 /DNA_ID= /DNA_START= /DNA_END= /DNA_ORIENTATION=
MSHAALVAAALAVRALPPVGRASEAGFGLSHRHRQREPGDAHGCRRAAL